MRTVTILLFLLAFLSNTQFLSGQTNSNNKKTVKQKAHDKKTAQEEYILSNDNNFQVNVYTVDEKSMTGKTHHWFVEIKDSKGKPVNYAKINLSGYLKSDPEVKFNYITPVFSLCNEGKYVIGFVRVNECGPWVLEAEVKSNEITDTFSWVININEKT